MPLSWENVPTVETIQIQHGFAAFPEGDKLREYVKEISPESGYYDVAMHGTEHLVGFNSGTGNLSVRELAQFIKRQTDYTGEDIRLLSCRTGAYVDDTEDCFAEELANAMGKNVKAPTLTLFIYPYGQMKVGLKNEGVMRVVRPNEKRRIK